MPSADFQISLFWLSLFQCADAHMFTSVFHGLSGLHDLFS
jgi:hypothetical protein